MGPVTVVLNTYRTIYGDKVDIVPNLYLAVALSKTVGEEACALEMYKLAIDNQGGDRLKIYDMGSDFILVAPSLDISKPDQTIVCKSLQNIVDIA